MANALSASSFSLIKVNGFSFDKFFGGILLEVKGFGEVATGLANALSASSFSLIEVNGLSIGNFLGDFLKVLWRSMMQGSWEGKARAPPPCKLFRIVPCLS